MKRLLIKLHSKRLVWFLIGVALIPACYGLLTFIKPTAKDAMGFVGYYQENKSIYTFLGDHTYSLEFPGDKKKFEKFAKRMGLSEHRISDHKFRIEGPDGDWHYGVIFDPSEKLRAIRFFSYSR